MPTFTFRQRAFIDWLAQGEDHRQPFTEAEFAATIGVSPRTLSRWKKRTGFREAVFQRALDHVETRLPSVLEALYRRAAKGEVSAVKLILSVTGHDTPRRQPDLDQPDLGPTIVVYERELPDGSHEYTDRPPWADEPHQ